MLLVWRRDRTRGSHITLVVGIDLSTQSCKVLVCDADTGEVVRNGRAPHPAGTEIDPAAWESAAHNAIAAAGGLNDVAAVSVGALQHGMVCLDTAGQVIRPALLWNDVRSADAALSLVNELGGPDIWANAVGVVPLAAITVAKLRWLADHEPHNADRTAAVCLPHDWLTWRLRKDPGVDTITTDRSDASGTGYYDAATDTYRADLLQLAMRGRRRGLPTILGAADAAQAFDGPLFGAGLGDNAAAALGWPPRTATLWSQSEPRAWFQRSHRIPCTTAGGRGRLRRRRRTISAAGMRIERRTGFRCGRSDAARGSRRALPPRAVGEAGKRRFGTGALPGW
jgi:sugar (pentulose or hexulose) kinase